MIKLQLLYLLITFLASMFAVGWIWGVHYTFQDGEIFGKIGNWLESKLPLWALKPTIGCPVCMASVHGTIIFLLFLAGIVPLWYWLVFVFMVCGFNAIIKRFLYGE